MMRCHGYNRIHYLGENFPRLFLRPPILYHWPVGLRFDLRGHATMPGEMDVVVERATALYKASSAAGNTSVVVAQD
jgi:hypothetical protein